MATPVIILLTLLTLLIRVGQTFALAGAVRSKNAGSVAARLLLDAATVAVVSYTVAGALSVVHPYDTSIVGARVRGAFPFDAATWVARLPVLLVVGGAVTAGSAERARWRVTIIVGTILACFVVPALIGWTSEVDSAFSHSAAGVAAVAAGFGTLVLCWQVGPRKNKFNRDLSVNHIPGHNLPLKCVGTALAGLGWLALAVRVARDSKNAATDEPSIALAGGLLAASAALIVAALYTRWRYHAPDLTLAAAATTAALIAATGGAGTVQPVWLGLTGASLGFFVPWSAGWLEKRLRVDDVMAVISTHTLGGTAAMLIAGTRGGGTSWTGPLAPALTVLFVVTVASGLAFLMLAVVARFGPIRMNEAQEYDGGDLVDLDANAYPDFQQTTIKSYHAREA